MKGYIQCAPPDLPKLKLVTFLSTMGMQPGDTIDGQDVTPKTTVVANIINAETDPPTAARKQQLLDEDARLRQLVVLYTIFFNIMQNNRTNVIYGVDKDKEGAGQGLGDGNSGATGDAGDGSVTSPIPNARCDFALDLYGKTLYKAALDDLSDGVLDRPDLAVIKEEVEEWFGSREQ